MFRIAITHLLCHSFCHQLLQEAYCHVIRRHSFPGGGVGRRFIIFLVSSSGVRASIVTTLENLKVFR